MTTRIEVGLWVLLVALGCANAATTEPAPEPDADWASQRFRDQYPSAPAGCLTLWVESEWGCAVATAAAPEPQQCVATPDPLILRARAMPEGELCHFAQNQRCDCSQQELDSWP